MVVKVVVYLRRSKIPKGQTRHAKVWKNNYNSMKENLIEVDTNFIEK